MSIVERKTSFTLIRKVERKTAQAVNQAMIGLLLEYPDFRAIDVSGIDQWVEFHTLGINVLSIYFDASHVAKRTEKEFVFGFGYEKQERDYGKKFADSILKKERAGVSVDR